MIRLFNRVQRILVSLSLLGEFCGFPRCWADDSKARRRCRPSHGLDRTGGCPRIDARLCDVRPGVRRSQVPQALSGNGLGATSSARFMQRGNGWSSQMKKGIARQSHP